MKQLKNQRGIVSILTVMFFGMLVMIVSLATMLAQTKELRQSTDADQSVRAYFAAEAGLEQAMAWLKADPKGRQNGCNEGKITKPEFSSGSELEVTCVKVAASTINTDGFLKQEESHQVERTGLTGVTLHWSGGSLNDTRLYGASAELPPTGTWSLPALMEVTVYSFPKENLAPNEIIAHTIFLRPSSNGGATANLNTNNTVQLIKCTTEGCSATISGFPTQFIAGDPRPLRHIVRFRPRYNSANYTISLSGGGGDSTSGGVRIDVTARAGSIFRRLVATSEGGGLPLGNGLDFVIFTQKDLCKDIHIDPATGKMKAGSYFKTGKTCRENEDATDEDPGTDFDTDPEAD